MCVIWPQYHNDKHAYVPDVLYRLTDFWLGFTKLSLMRKLLSVSIQELTLNIYVYIYIYIYLFIFYFIYSSSRSMPVVEYGYNEDDILE